MPLSDGVWAGLPPDSVSGGKSGGNQWGVVSGVTEGGPLPSGAFVSPVAGRGGTSNHMSNRLRIVRWRPCVTALVPIRGVDPETLGASVTHVRRSTVLRPPERCRAHTRLLGQDGDVTMGPPVQRLANSRSPRFATVAASLELLL